MESSWDFCKLKLKAGIGNTENWYMYLVWLMQSARPVTRQCNTVGAAASSGCYLRMFIYLYNALLYVFGMLKHKKCHYQHHKISTENWILHSVKLHRTSCVYVCFLKMSCFWPRLFNKVTTWIWWGGHILFCRLISIFIFDILQIHSGCIAPTCTPYLSTCNEQT